MQIDIQLYCLGIFRKVVNVQKVTVNLCASFYALQLERVRRICICIPSHGPDTSEIENAETELGFIYSGEPLLVTRCREVVGQGHVGTDGYGRT